MPLNAAIIKQKLASAPRNQKDNRAQKMINQATSAELKSLEVESIMRLYESMAMLPPRIYSSNDAAAMKTLPVAPLPLAAMAGVAHVSPTFRPRTHSQTRGSSGLLVLERRI